MVHVILFLVCFVALAGFALYLSRTIEHGEAKFATTDLAEKDATARETDRDVRRGADKGVGSSATQTPHGLE